MRTAFICFFPVYPTNMGSAEVIRSLFINWPKEKKLFQISHLNKINIKNVSTLKIIFENSLLKILKIPYLMICVINYLRYSKKKIAIIEGPSWIGYSLFAILILKVLSPSTIIIYHSHSIEYEVRKINSSKIIVFFTKIFENLVFSLSNIKTSVSKIEQKKIKQLYNINTVLLYNGVSKKRLNYKKKNIKFDYIIYSGSYKYLPNKEAIDYLTDVFMPIVLKKFPNMKLILTGGGYNKKLKFVMNLGIIEKKKLLNLISNSIAMVAPLEKGTGTRIKIIEALLIGTPVISTHIGAEGIEKQKNKADNFYIIKKENFIRILYKVIKNRKGEKKFIKNYEKKYAMENILKNFLKNKNVKRYF